MFETFILAGGKSNRMGKEKSLIQIDGEKLVERAVRIATQAYPERIALVTGTKAKSLAPHFTDLEVLDDISPELGAAGGILTALEDSLSDCVFVLACDLPFVTPELIDFLKDRFDRGDADAVVPVQADKFKQPLCAFYRKSTCSAPFRAQILRSDLSPSVRDLLDRVKTVYVDFEEYAALEGSSDFFLNINTPSDLEFARKLAKAK